jgi:class 3 adenylate cyclase
VLDLMLPDMDGLDVCRRIRQRDETPILMLTARGDAMDRVVGLEMGADDYLPKPFEPRELLARVKSVLRRGAAKHDTAPARRIAAILASDVAGYSRLVGDDEEGTLARLRAIRRELIDPEIGAHRGRIVRIIEFASAVDAVRCAVALQHGLAARAFEPPDRQIQFRMGINVGDVLADGDDILGDSVNIADRLEGIAEPGGICLSAAAYEQVRGKLEIAVGDMGEQNLKNIARPVRTYCVLL